MINADPPLQSASLTVEQALQQALAHHQAGQLQAAEHLYRAILKTQPNHPDANHNLGVLSIQVKQPAAALPHFKVALEANPNQSQYWLSYINALIQAGQIGVAREALARGRQLGLSGESVEALVVRLEKPRRGEPDPQEIATLMSLFTEERYTEVANLAHAMTVRFPHHGVGWKALGAVFTRMGRSADALASLQTAVALLPADAVAHSNLGNALYALGQFSESEASCRRALEITPDLAEAHCNLGNTLHGQSRLDEAEVSYRRALQLRPDLAEVHSNLGDTLHGLGRLDEAEASYRRALQIKPDYADALYNLVLRLNEQGKSMMALNIIRQSLSTKETGEAKRIFVDCVKRQRFTRDDKEIRVAIVRALTELWGPPGELAPIGIALLKLNPLIQGCVARARDAWPQRLSAENLFGSNGLAALAADPLLRALLCSAPICDIEMERFLTMARHAMLEAAFTAAASGIEIDTVLNFYGALANQCFVNEYAFSHVDDEIQRASDLRKSLAAALAAKTQVPVLSLLAVAAYFPLRSLPHAYRLLSTRWPEAVEAILIQQVREPEEELQLHAVIPRLTTIEDEVSLLVRNQYEENPYPRWIRTEPPPVKSRNIFEYLRQRFPLTSFKHHGRNGGVDVLIAGCGTGQHSIQTAQLLQDANILAVDLSISSLSYAMRKTRELGLISIQYAQADLLKLEPLGRSFDVVESIGVLHHLADPWAGWRVLMKLLRPGGFMRLGFYSEVARRNIAKARVFVAEQGYGATNDEIRRCRQDLMKLGETADFGFILKVSDFFSISACRDMLFHVQEHCMTLTSIEAFLRDNELAFLGFEIGGEVLHAYRKRFPADRAATNLGQWQIFENENPDTFLGMYRFWSQKVA